MARIDAEVIRLLEAGGAVPLAELAELSSDQLDQLRRVALMQIGLNPSNPAAARVAALKDAAPGTGGPSETGEKPDPGSMSLDQIEAELRDL